MGAPLPWRNWYHCVGNTYGTWVYRDARGFRARHHREHIIGDDHFPPPPGKYERELWRSLRAMKRPPVWFRKRTRPLACELLRAALHHHAAEVVALSVSAMHFHLIARFVPVGVDPYGHLRGRGIQLTHADVATAHSAYDRDPAPRRFLGLARSFMTHELKTRGHCADHTGGLWAKRPHCIPIECRGHQVACVHYIRAHAESGAAVFIATKPTH